LRRPGATDVKDRTRPPQPSRRLRGRWPALALAVVVNLAFVGVLVFSVSWRNPTPPAVTAELYAPPSRAPAAPPPIAEPPKPPPPKAEPPKAEPPRPEPPKPVPKAEPRPEPKVAKPDPREAEIAQKARAEAEKKKRDDAERARAEAEKRKRDDAERARAEAEKAKREADARERQERQTAALRAEAEREAKSRADAEAKARADAEARARADAESRARAAESAARSRAEADWIRSIQAKVRGNVTLPPDLPGNPEAIFEVVQLPTGEIIEAQLRKSSGVRAYDEAVQRAILKSSPLPRPERADLFQRTLTLKFRPVD
jgi:colicin import membrane protein